MINTGSSITASETEEFRKEFRAFATKMEDMLKWQQLLQIKAEKLGLLSEIQVKNILTSIKRSIEREEMLYL